MPRKDDEREFRLRPRKPPKGRSEGAAWAAGFKLLIHHARASRIAVRRRSRSFGISRPSRPHNQRCAVRVMYSRNTVRGQWRAHGRYVVRESATIEEDAKAVGFDRSGQGVEMAARLGSWQAEGDGLLWKMILSPELGDRADLSRLTRDLMERMEQDLGMPLEWVAVSHHNTEHPHVHLALRGVAGDGRPVLLNRDYVKQGIRGIAEDLCTRQLGFRTQLDAAEAERREITEKRFTSLDRIIARGAANVSNESSSYFKVMRNPLNTSPTETGRLQEQHVAARLAVLEDMGLAESSGANVWRVRCDFETVLRAMQRTGDRQKVLAAHGVLMSDERLPIEILGLRRQSSIEGRILVHGQDEQSGRNYLMLEGTDAKVHFIQYTAEMEEARNRGGLRTNSFIRLRKLSVDGDPLLQIDDMGNSEAMLNNRRYFENTVQQLIKRGIIPEEDGWGGWLGRYQATLRKIAMQLEEQQHQYESARQQRRYSDRSQGR